MSRRTTLAALDADGWYVEGRGFYPSERRDGGAARLFAVMAAAELDVLYVHASALPVLGLPVELPPPPPGERRQPHEWLAGVEGASSRALAPSITDEDDREILIGAWQGGSGDPFGEAEHGAELLAAAVAYRDALAGWTFRHSAITTGSKLMHAPWTTPARRRKYPDLLDECEHPAELLGQQVEQPYGSRWRADRELGQRGRYVVAYDVNGQRLAACARLNLGVAELAERTGGGFDPKLPGYHLVSSIEHPHEGRIPPIFEPGWHTTPRVAMAAHLGLDFTIDRSYLWGRHVAYLNPWYERLRDARRQLLVAPTPSAKIALQALKPTYLEALGRLRSERTRSTGSPYFRPHWYDSVIGQELAREYLRLHQLADAGVAVLAVYFDTIIIETDDPAGNGVPGVIDCSPQLGKWKLVGSPVPAQDARDVLYESGQVGQLVKLLDRYYDVNGAGNLAVGAAALQHNSTGAYNTTRPVHGGYPEVTQ